MFLLTLKKHLLYHLYFVHMPRYHRNDYNNKYLDFRPLKLIVIFNLIEMRNSYFIRMIAAVSNGDVTIFATPRFFSSLRQSNDSNFW